jgi:hypothetical protein
MSSVAFRRSGNLPGSGFGITRRTFDQIEDYIQDNKASVDRVKFGIDKLAHAMGLIVLSDARRSSFGPVAPRFRSNPALAHRIPVQRITGEYYAGWYLRKAGNGRYLVGNETFQAYLIETGMHQQRRRPILKMAVISMLKFIQTTRTADRFLDSVLAPRRNARGQFQSFDKRIIPFKMRAAAVDMPSRGAGNPHIRGPKGRIPS